MSRAPECKKTAAIILYGTGIAFDRLTARTRGECVFVRVVGARPQDGVFAAFRLAEATAREHGFKLEFSQQ